MTAATKEDFTHVRAAFLARAAELSQRNAVTRGSRSSTMSGGRHCSRRQPSSCAGKSCSVLTKRSAMHGQK